MFFSGTFFFFFRPFSWFLLGKTLFSYGSSVISLGCAWFFLGKTLFSYGFRVISLGFLVSPRENTIFLRLPCHFLRFSRGNTLPWLFLGNSHFPDIFAFFRFSPGNIRYLGYSSGKSDFPDIFAFWTDFVVLLLLLLMFLLLLVLLLLLLLLLSL